MKGFKFYLIILPPRSILSDGKYIHSSNYSWSLSYGVVLSPTLWHEVSLFSVVFRSVCPCWLFLSCPLVHLVDIWNVIEALRENALNNLDPSIELNVARLEAVISTIFYQLNKRMPTTHQINVEQSISLLLNFLLAAFDPWVCLSQPLVLRSSPDWWKDFTCSRNIFGNQLNRLNCDPNNERVNSAN